MAPKASPGRQEPYFKNTTVTKVQWDLMTVEEQEQIQNYHAYKDDIDFLKEAEARAVDALVKHHQDERKDLTLSFMKATKDRRQILNRVRGRHLAAKKRRQLARIDNIKRRPAGSNIVKKPAREP